MPGQQRVRRSILRADAQPGQAQHGGDLRQRRHPEGIGGSDRDRARLTSSSRFGPKRLTSGPNSRLPSAGADQQQDRHQQRSPVRAVRDALDEQAQERCDRADPCPIQKEHDHVDPRLPQRPQPDAGPA